MEESARRNHTGKRGVKVRFLGYDDEGRAVNQAEVWLLSSELPLFMGAIVTHHSPLPTDYKQTAEPSGKGFKVKMRSHESPKFFAARLSSALGCLKQPA